MILLGSVLEGLLLSRVLLSRNEGAPTSEKSTTGACANWRLAALIETAIAQGWVRRSMRGWGRDMLGYRNAIHPWNEAAAALVFNAVTYRSRRKIVRVIAEDLAKSAGAARWRKTQPSKVPVVAAQHVRFSAAKTRF
ncbi:MAG TPA: hypothetical protein VGC36_15790 [Rhizomicrobium sp.]